MEGNGRDAARSRPFPRPRFIDPLRAEVALSSCGRRSGDEPRRASSWRSRSLTQRAGVEDLELPRAQPVEHPGLDELRERTGEALRRDPDRGRELPRPHRQLDHDERDRASGRQHAEDLHASRLERYEHPGVVALAPEQGPRLERAVVRVRREERADLPGKTLALFRQGGGTRGHQGGHSSSTIYPRLCELWRTDGTAARSWWRWTPRPRPRAPG